MSICVRFHTTLFDPASEPVNPINPLRGWSLIEWLRTQVPTDVASTAPEAEDWGWYSDMTWRGRRYLVGVGVNEASDGNHEWMLHLDKVRSITERLLGRETMTPGEPFFELIMETLRREPRFTDIGVERGR